MNKWWIGNFSNGNYFSFLYRNVESGFDFGNFLKEMTFILEDIDQLKLDFNKMPYFDAVLVFNHFNKKKDKSYTITSEELEEGLRRIGV